MANKRIAHSCQRRSEYSTPHPRPVLTGNTTPVEDPNRSVLLLEAGHDYPDIDSLPDEVKYGYATATDIVTSDHNWQFTAKATDTPRIWLL